MRSIPVCFVVAALLLSGCHTGHLITVRADRSAVIRNFGRDVRHLHGSPAMILMDTSALGSSIVLIKDIDSLGRYLPTFDPQQVTVSLRGDTLSVRFKDAPLLKGWRRTGLTFFVERGIYKVLPSKRKVSLVNDGIRIRYAAIGIRKKVLEKRPEDLSFSLVFLR
jgi:hypothetical protein